MTTADAGTEPLSFSADLGGLRAVPLRIAVSVLSLGPWLWATIAVATPVAVLASQLVWATKPPGIVFASGLVYFTLWMVPIRYDRSLTTVDSAAAEVRIDRPTGTGEETRDVHDLEAVERATIRRLGPVALVYLQSDSASTSYPTFVAPVGDLPNLTTALRSAGVDVDSTAVLDPAAGGPLARLLVTLLVAIGVPAVGAWRFGAGILVIGLIALLLPVGITLLGGAGLRRLIAR